MKIQIKETGEIKEITIDNQGYDFDVAEDMYVTYEGIEEEEIYEMIKSKYLEWNNFFKEMEETDEILEEFKNGLTETENRIFNVFLENEYLLSNFKTRSKAQLRAIEEFKKDPYKYHDCA